MRVFVDGKELPGVAEVRVTWPDAPVTLPDGKERSADVSVALTHMGAMRVVVARDAANKRKVHAEEEFSVSDFCRLTTL